MQPRRTPDSRLWVYLLVGLQLEAKGIPSPRGRSTWAFNSVRTILGCET